jgi:hydrogenase nickel incorporation protein HypB
MCRDCGCSQANQEHEHWVDGKRIVHSHAPPRLIEMPRRITLEQSVLAKNDRIAAENRQWFLEHDQRVLNLISSPGSGKTMLLEKTVERLGPEFSRAILTGDQERDFDAQRLKGAGAEVLQLNTASSCHLDAAMIQKQLGQFVRPEHRLVVIENVGNLVCPAAFDLGEGQKVALLSCTEGEDKPSKYPLLFHEAGLIVLSKMDLVPHLDWSLELCEQHIRKVNPHAPILRLSARTGEGMDAWVRFIRTGSCEP